MLSSEMRILCLVLPFVIVATPIEEAPYVLKVHVAEPVIELEPLLFMYEMEQEQTESGKEKEMKQ